MNLYQVFYTYNEPCMESPECTVEGSMQIKAYNHPEAKRLVNLAKYRQHENFTIVRSKLIRKDCDSLIRNDGQIKGIGALFRLSGCEITIIASDANNLEVVFDKLFEGYEKRLDRSLLQNVKVMKDDN